MGFEPAETERTQCNVDDPVVVVVDQGPNDPDRDERKYDRQEENAAEDSASANSLIQQNGNQKPEAEFSGDGPTCVLAVVYQGTPKLRLLPTLDLIVYPAPLATPES